MSYLAFSLLFFTRLVLSCHVLTFLLAFLSCFVLVRLSLSFLSCLDLGLGRGVGVGLGLGVDLGLLPCFVLSSVIFIDRRII